MKDTIPRGLPTRDVHKFLYVSCNAHYFGETSRHLSYVSTWSVTSHSFRHLPNFQQCCTLCSDECFSILDHAPQLPHLKSKKLSTSNGSNLHSIINFIMLI